MSGFAGTIRERVVLLTPTAARDALGAPGEDWTVIGPVWASIVPAGTGAASAGDALAALPLWRATLRPCPVKVGDRLERTNGTIDVIQVIVDPRQPDRVVAIGEERR